MQPALDTQSERHDLGRTILDELMLDGEDALLDIDMKTQVSDDDPLSALIDAVGRHHACAIVLGAKHHSRLREALGTVTIELLKISPVPVVTVPLSVVIPPGSRSRPPLPRRKQSQRDETEGLANRPASAKHVPKTGRGARVSSL